MTGARAQLQLRRPPGAGGARRLRPLCEARLPTVRVPGMSLGDSGIARRRLQVLLQKLDRFLDESPKVVRDSSGYTVWVFGAVGFHVDRGRRAVYPLVRDEYGRVLLGNFTLELLHPLATPHFLPFVIRYLGLSDGARQGHLFRSRSRIAAEEHWMAHATYRLLGRDARFRDLRVRRLPAALALDPVLASITLASRRVLDSRIASDQYSFAWRHARELRAVARENPGLLPLVAAALDERWILPFGDAVEELHLLFRERRLAPATWRYVAHYGTRFLRPVWARVGRRGRTGAALQLLREIERAGHPAPPPQRVIREWLRVSTCPRGTLESGWNAVPADVAGICLREARRVRGTAAERLLWEDLRLVLQWAARERPRLCKLQRRAGWPWLLRQAAASERRRLLLEVEGPRTWPFALGEVVSGEFRATPVDSVEGLVDEGMAFHNCIAGYVGMCQRSEARIFAVRQQPSGKRIGVIRLDHQPFADGWGLQNVLGIANAPVGGPLWAFACDLAERYNEAMAGMPHESEGWSSKFGEVLADMEADAG
jgi:hypothetical protein